jgi:hypothetical protein
LEAERSSHQRYLDLYKLMKRRDKEFFDDPRRSTATLQIMLIHKHALFTEDEFSQFSQDMQEFALRFSG